MTNDELFRITAASVPALISYVGDDYRFRWANRMYESWFHLRTDEIVGRPVQEILGDEVWDVVRPYMAQALGGDDVTWEAELPYRDGPRWVRVTYVPDRDEHGTVRGLVVLVTEIGEQKRAEQQVAALTDILRSRVEELQLREARYRALFEMASVGAAQTDAITGRFLTVNRRLCEITGYDEAALLERTVGEITHPDDRDRDWARFQSAVRGERDGWLSETRWVRRDGNIAWVLVTGRIVPSAEGRLQAVAHVLDVTERHTTQRALNEAQERFRVAQELSFDGFSILRPIRDEGGTIVDFLCEYVNSAASTVLRRSWDEMVGKPVLETLPGLRLELFERFVAVAETGVAHDDEIFYDADGIHGWFRNMAVRLRDGIAVSFADITARRDLEATLRAHVEELHREHRRKDEFLAMLAHELRNPLAPIQNVTALLARQQKGDQTLSRLSGILERQLGQLTRLVDDLLDVSRINGGRIQLQRVRTDLSNVVGVAVETARPVVDQHAHDLTVSLPPGPLWVEGDPVRLAQVVSNLLNNAAKYTDRGGHIELRVEFDDGHALIRVQDDGIGIPPESIATVFDMFAQVEREARRSVGGLGIGLTLVRRLIELHGGTVEAQSDGPGLGSLFTVRLPLAPASSEPISSDRVSQDTGGGLHLLVVDDNVDAAETLGVLLRTLGHHVCVVFDGRAALADTERHRHDIVFLDLGMPEVDGYAVARAIRARADANGELLVALTGWGEAEARRRSSEAGFDHHLVKPVQIDELEAMLARVSRA